MKIDPSKKIPTASSNGSSWVQWHKDLKEIFGKKKANSIWIYAWGKRGGKTSPANTSALRSYMSGEGVNVDTTTLSALGDTVDGVFEGIGNFASVTGYVIIGVGVVSFFIVARALYGLTKDPNKTIEQALKVGAMSSTGGASAMIPTK
jgi:hypothetical protein